MFSRKYLIRLVAISFCLTSMCDLPANADEFNYDESKVPSYTLPKALVMQNGTLVTTADQWPARRAQIKHLFEQEVYGRVPDSVTLDNVTHTVQRIDRGVLGGIADRKMIRLKFGDAAHVDVMLYLPAKADGPVPAFVGLNFGGNHTTTTDKTVPLTSSWTRSGNHKATEESRGSAAGRWPFENIVKRGYAVATAYYGDIDPDFDDGFKNGVHAVYNADAKPAANEWGSIATWAWGLSRILDYLATDGDIDDKKVAVMGHSRLGKTSLWAGAADERFAIVVSNNSGCGGAALSRRAFGETVKRINTSFPHWFCDNYLKYNDQEDSCPVDQHMLMALIAPRPVLVCSAEEDRWADPRGEFTSAMLADDVYRLLGTDGVASKEMPGLNNLFKSAIGYHIRPGKHNVLPADWEVYMDFADHHYAKNVKQ